MPLRRFLKRTASATLAVAGGSMLVWSFLGNLGEIRNGKASEEWPFVHGTIETSGVASESIQYGRTGGQAFYVPEIEYVYKVAGKAYRGKRTQFGRGPTLPTRQAMQRLVDESYPQGGEVVVCYNPLDPSNSVLSPGLPVDRRTWSSFLFASVIVGSLAVFGLVWMWGLIR